MQFLPCRLTRGKVERNKTMKRNLKYGVFENTKLCALDPNRRTDRVYETYSDGYTLRIWEERDDNFPLYIHEQEVKTYDDGAKIGKKLVKEWEGKQ